MILLDKLASVLRFILKWSFMKQAKFPPNCSWWRLSAHPMGVCEKRWGLLYNKNPTKGKSKHKAFGYDYVLYILHTTDAAYIVQCAVSLCRKYAVYQTENPSFFDLFFRKKGGVSIIKLQSQAVTEKQWVSTARVVKIFQNLPLTSSNM